MNTTLKFSTYAAFCVAVLAGVLLGGPLAAHANLTAVANHDYIAVDYNYHGSTVSVKGIADPDVDLLIKISAPNSDLAMRTKQHVGGVLWMNMGELHMGETPRVYHLFGTARPEVLLNQEDRDAYALGYDALEREARMSLKGMEETAAGNAQWFKEFVKYQERSHLYGESFGQVKLVPEQDSGRYEMQMDWPYQAPPGVYDVTVYAVRGGKVVETATSSVTVEQVGAVKYLANMARNNGALYGVLSILIALASGFGVGMVFRSGGGAH